MVSGFSALLLVGMRVSACLPNTHKELGHVQEGAIKGSPGGKAAPRQAHCRLATFCPRYSVRVRVN